MTSTLIIGTVACALLLGGCATTTTAPVEQRIAVAADVFLVMPRHDELTESFNATQVITAQFGDRSRSFEAHLEARPGSVTIVGVTALGVALFTIRYDGDRIEATGSMELRDIEPEYVLADVLLTHRDAGWLNERLSGASIVVSEDGRERTVIRAGEPVISIRHDNGDPWSGTATLEHIERQYRLDITTVDYTRP